MGDDSLERPVRPLTVAAEVTQRLRGLIRAGELRPGDRIPSERELAHRLGAGRPAVREALRDLKTRGLLVSGRGRQGTVVAAVPTHELVAGIGEAAGEGAEHLADLMELRCAVEIQAAGLAARRSDRNERRGLARILGPVDQPLTSKEDRAFHRMIAQASGNPLFSQVIATLTDLFHERMPVLLGDLYARPGTTQTLHGQHRGIVRAIERGDEEAAREAMRQHLSFVGQALAQLAGSGRVIRLVVIDLDGTLLSGPNEMSERTRTVVARVRDTGVEVALASARLPRYIAPHHRALKLSLPVVACNGALLWDLADGVPIARAALDLGIAAEVVALARRTGAIANIESDDEWFADRVNQRILTNIRRFGIMPPQGVGVLDEVLAAGGPADKVFVDLRDMGQAGGEVRDQLHRLVAGRATLTETVPGLLDIISLNASKAVMARKLSRSIDVPPEQVMAIGDHENDIPLLEWAGFGVAMGNASPPVKAIADAVTSSNLRDGAAEALERWVLGVTEA